MKNYIIIKKKIKSFNNTINVSGDKSISIRCILLASQGIGSSKIYNLLESEDVMNSLKSIKKLGINYKKISNYYLIKGLGPNGFNTNKKIILNAGNSGTFARLILGLLVNTNNEIKIIGDKSLSIRDFSRVTEPLKKFGAIISSNKNNLPVKINGTNFLRPINYEEKLGSAQCKSTVILAAIKTPGITKIKAKKSRDHTELLLKNLGFPIKVNQKKNFDFIEINGQNNFRGFEYTIPGDISSSAFFLVLTLLSKESKLKIKNVNVNKSRTGIIKILNMMNANILLKNKKIYKGEAVSDIYIKSKNNLKGIKCPKSLNSSAIDEFLLIFLVAAKSKGISSFKNLTELNKKESPRLDIAVNFIKKIGIKVTRNNDDIKIYGNPNLELSGKFIINNFKKDHRVFMMSCIAALTLGGKWKIYDKDSINSSFPKFLKLIKKLGAKIN
tara:strand:+ start:9209 stop:10534 length:1326 start_codon:yes stop_codon:yes gene_type:complete